MKKLLRKLFAVSMCLLMLITGAAVVPGIDDSGITASAAGNSFDNALNINLNSTYIDNISSKNENDYYSFILKSDSKINVNFSHIYFDDYNAYWRLYLYNYDHIEIYSYFRIPGNIMNLQMCNIGLPKGQYYIKVVSGDIFTDSNYKITINSEVTDAWELELNEGYNTGSLINTNKSYFGTIT